LESPIEIYRRLSALEKDMWFGNGKPGITTRMAVMEDIVRRIDRNLTWFVRLTAASILTALASIAVAVFLLLAHVPTR
jgi:hypothetical protein